MKSSKTLLDFFHVQNVPVSCPACGTKLQKSKLNSHLDSDCPSSVSLDRKIESTSRETRDTFYIYSKTAPREIISKQPKQNTKMPGISKQASKKNTRVGRLSLKQQKTSTNCKSIQLESLNAVKEIDVITLDENSSSSTDNNILKCSDVDLVEDKSKFLSCDQKNAAAGKIQCDILSPAAKSECNSEQCLETTVQLSTLCDVKDKESVAMSTEVNNIKDDTIQDQRKFYEIKNMTGNKCISSFSMSKSASNVTKSESVDNLETNADVLAILNDATESLEADDNVFRENTGHDKKTEEYSPYYIANFKHILNTVLNDKYNEVLFNDEDRSFIKAFESSSDAAQKLYVRLFQRKFNWLRLNKIIYPKITQDPEKVLNELVNIELVDLGLDKIDLNTALGLLSSPEAKTIAKHFKLNLSGKRKGDITQMLLRHCKEHKSILFYNGKNSMSNLMLKKVKDVLGPCYRISLLPKRLFTRILMLFSLPTMSEDDDDAAGGQQQQLFTLLQVNKGEIIFPNYKITRQIMIFTDRDDLIRYEEAKQLENDIMNAVESKNFDLAKELCNNAKEEFDKQLTCAFAERKRSRESQEKVKKSRLLYVVDTLLKSFLQKVHHSEAASLPTFLKKYTSFHVYVRCMTQGVDVLQRLRQYKEAVKLLKHLLNQKVFSQDYRGFWWDRLTLNLDQHLKQREQAIEEIKEVIKDENVRVGYRYTVLMRGLRILKTVDEPDDFKKDILEATSDVIEAPKVIIKGRILPNILGRRNVFISSSSTATDEDDVTVLNVENLAIEHYKKEGFTEGIHGESSTFHSLYGLLFWDIIYDGDIPDAFISPYQHHPLDLNHSSFFVRREKQILSHLETLRNSTIEELKEIIKSSWEAHFGQVSLVMWDRFTDVDHILGLVNCMGNTLVCGICERLARDFRFTRSGVPDLVVWNPESLKVKIVEVKGPGDRLSSKQILWLDYLIKVGAEAEVCHVEAVGSKKLRKE